MSYKFEYTTIAGRQCFVFLPANYGSEDISYPVAYIHGDKTTYDLLKEAEFLSELDYIIIGIDSENRLDELTPWPSVSLHEKFPDFGGKGNDYLQFIETVLKPAVDQMYQTLSAPETTALLGYSLGGLISMYAAYKMTCFGNYASISGSYWYLNFIDYAKNHSIKNENAKIYMSSGNQEGVGHKDVKKDAVLYTQQMYDIAVKALTEQRVTILWDEGGHHDNRLERYKKALLWLQSQMIIC